MAFSPYGFRLNELLGTAKPVAGKSYVLPFLIIHLNRLNVKDFLFHGFKYRLLAWY